MFASSTPLIQENRFPGRVLIGLAFLETLLMFVWSISGTIALRNALLLLMLVAIPLARIDFAHFRSSLRHGVILVLLALTVWIVVHNVFLAWNPALSWYESVQWFKSMVCLIMGVALACVPRGIPVSRRWRFWVLGVCAAWALHLLLNLILRHWAGPFVEVLEQPTPIGTRDMVSYLGTGLLAVLLADGVARLEKVVPLLPLSSRWLFAVTAMAMVLTTATMTRNALPVMALEIGIAVIALIAGSATRTQRWCRGGIAAGVLLLVCVAFTANLMLDARWRNFADSARIALDIDHSTWWIDQVKNPHPMTAQGVPVDPSAYNRIAWMRGAGRLITVYPLGTGYDRNAFRRALMRYYGAANTASGHAHAGLLDFTLATGIPGGIMLVTALTWAIVAGWRRWRRAQDVAGLVLAIFVASYLLRAAVDGIVRDHMLEQAMFVMGLLLAASTELGQKKTA
jgi:hypothetical protein